MDKQLDELVQAMVSMGNECGERIAEILKKQHPNATVYPLYRSAVAIEYDEQERELIFYLAGDPHAWGNDITEETVKKITTVRVMVGDRFGPELESEEDSRTLLDLVREDY